MRHALVGAGSDQNSTKRLTCASADEKVAPDGWGCFATASIAMPHFRAFLMGYYSLPTSHGTNGQRSLSSGSGRSRQSRSIGEMRVDGPVPLLPITSRPLPEEGWQFRQALKSWSRPCLGMRRRADQNRSGSELGCPIKSVSAVIDDQRLFRPHADVGEDARIILWPCFEGVDQVGPIETTKA